MSELHRDVSFVLQSFPIRPAEITPLGNAGGFSGATFWRVHAESGTYCLRAWPKKHGASRISLFRVLATLEHAASNGFSLAPTSISPSLVNHNQHWWHLATWLPGETIQSSPLSDAQVANAMATLASFHRAAVTEHMFEPASSPGIRSRRTRLQELRTGLADRIAQALPRADWPELATASQTILERFRQNANALEQQLTHYACMHAPMQRVIRDIWRENLLFIGDEVTGVVDFWAMRNDSVAMDIGRLLPSIPGGDARLYAAGIQAYETIRPLSDIERQLIAAFENSFHVLAGLNWLEWLYIDEIQFPDRNAVIQRVKEIAN